MLNNVILMGNMGRAPKIWLTHDGQEIATFFLATRIKWKACPQEGGEPGEWQSCTDWHRVTVFRGSTVKWIKEKLKQGDTLYVEGKLTYSQSKDKFGQTHFKPHIVIAGRDGCIEYIRSSRTEAEENSSFSSNNRKRPFPKTSASGDAILENADQDKRKSWNVIQSQSEHSS